MSVLDPTPDHSLDPTSDRSLGAQLADLIRAQIKSGSRWPGSKLPSESQFHERYGVSRTTVRDTLKVLAGEGLIETRKGYGSFVRERRRVRRIVRGHDHSGHVKSGKPIFDTLVEASGQRPGRRMLSVGRVPLPVDVREHLDLPTDVNEIAIRKRLQLIDDEPMVISTSYYPLWYSAGTRLEQQEAIPQGPDALIEELGHVFGSVREIHSVRMPDPDEQRLLAIKAGGVPLFRIIRIDYSTTGKPMVLSDDLYRGDCFEFVVEDTTVR